MLNWVKKAIISDRAEDTLIYGYVYDEIESDIIVKGLWSKALAYSEGNDELAKSLYRKYRVQDIKDSLVSSHIAYEEMSEASLMDYLQNTFLPTKRPKVQSFGSVKTPQLNNINDEDYLVVMNEVETGNKDSKIWAQSFIQGSGDHKEAEVIYMHLRLKDIQAKRLELEEEKQLKLERDKIQLEQKKQELIQLELQNKNIEEFKKQELIKLELNNQDIDNTWIDQSTNLGWQLIVDSKKYTWDEALKYEYYYNSLSNGISNWRIPTKEELETLITDIKSSCSNGYEYYIKKDLLDTMKDNNKFSFYWSSTPYNNESSSSAWGVYFGYGKVSNENKTNKYYIRLVRDII